MMGFARQKHFSPKKAKSTLKIRIQNLRHQLSLDTQTLSDKGTMDNQISEVSLSQSINRQYILFVKIHLHRFPNRAIRAMGRDKKK